MNKVERVAVVTGANRGLGLETCRQLAGRGYHVILTSRNEHGGEAAAQRLAKTAGKITYHPLDVLSDDSVARLRDFILNEIGRVDVLVNNAAVYVDAGRSVLNVELEVFHLTMNTNTFGPLRLCRAFVPLMMKQNYGRIVNVSSSMGQLSTMADGTSAYRLSKVALNALTLIVANAVRGRDILVNAVDPGWVKTDMGGRRAPRSVEDGADTIVWLATLPKGGPSGGFFRDRSAIEW